MRHGVILIAALALLHHITLDVRAQDGDGPEIPSSVISKTSTLGFSDEKKVKDYAEHWVEQLGGRKRDAEEIEDEEVEPKEGEAKEGDAKVGEDAKPKPKIVVKPSTKRLEMDRLSATARKRLIQPLRNPNASQFFLIAYSKQVSNALIQRGLLRNKRVAARLNAIIVVAYLRDPGAVTLAITGMADAADAVRYWAAKAVSQIATLPDKEIVIQKTDPASRARATTLVAAITVAINQESSSFVRTALSQALVDVNTPASMAALLTWMNGRVTIIGGGRAKDVTAERAALVALKKMVLTKGQTWNTNAVSLRNTLRVSYRMLDVSMAMMHTASPRMKADLKEIAQLAADYLITKGTVPLLNKDFVLPTPSFTKQIQSDADPRQIYLGVLEFKDRLAEDEKIGIKKTALKVDVKVS